MLERGKLMGTVLVVQVKGKFRRKPLKNPLGWSTDSSYLSYEGREKTCKTLSDDFKQLEHVNEARGENKQCDGEWMWV